MLRQPRRAGKPRAGRCSRGAPAAQRRRPPPVEERELDDDDELPRELEDDADELPRELEDDERDGEELLPRDGGE
jgi:hypothetical protein